MAVGWKPAFRTVGKNLGQTTGPQFRLHAAPVFRVKQITVPFHQRHPGRFGKSKKAREFLRRNVVRHVIGSMNPQGCRVVAFKQPTVEESAHDFLWRVEQKTPKRGEVVIFNRSHYEDVIVVRAHDLVPKKIWSQRYEQINDFERRLVADDTHILKFFLPISKEEQLRRFEKRLDDPARRWKISEGVEKKAYEQFASSFDAELGGFGPAPKFPRPVILNFLDRIYATDPDSKDGQQALEMTLVTLRKMAEGGIHDQLGGGFHRYSTDKFWHVPHFEKMLYDQAQLAIAYLNAYQITREPVFEQTARDILDYVRRDMTDKDGGFYSAEDADSLIPVAAVYDRRTPPGTDALQNADGGHRPPLQEHAEGAFYVWTKTEIDQVLGAERAKVFDYFCGVEVKGNAPADPQGEFKNKNILIQRHSVSETAKQFKLSDEKAQQLLAESRKLLLAVRAKRPRPRVDDKIVTAWNGLMISAFARGYQVLGDPAYLEAANNSARFVREKLYDAESNTLLRSYREGASDVHGFASDYAFLTQGLLDLYAAGFDVSRMEWAVKLQEQQNALFWDEKNGGYFSTSGQDKNVLLRMKEDYDGAEPSPNSVAALNLLRLAVLLDKSAWREQAGKTMHAFDAQLNQAPAALPQMLVALDWSRAKPKQIVIAGKPDAADTEAMLREVNLHFIPNKVLILADGGAGQKFFSAQVDFMKAVGPIDQQATAYVCENYVCQLPTTDVKKLAELLIAKPKKPSP